MKRRKIKLYIGIQVREKNYLQGEKYRDDGREKDNNMRRRDLFFFNRDKRKTKTKKEYT